MSQRQENKMGVMPVKKLIITMSLPMMVSMLVQALYNIVDSIFVSQINEQALTFYRDMFRKSYENYDTSVRRIFEENHHG